jgi:hypothetical protein
MFRVAVTIRVAGVFFLNLRGVGQHQRDRDRGCRRTKHASLETF